MKLNLGACDRPFPGFLSVDIVPPADQIVDLSKPWPWLDSSIEEVRAHDVIEHIGDEEPKVHWEPDGTFSPGRHPSGRIHFMNELHRVLKPGARATIETPNASRGAGFFQDPTHKSAWCLNSFQYFEAGSFAHKRLSKPYGITAAFHIIQLSETPYRDAYEQVWKITAVLEAVK